MTFQSWLLSAKLAWANPWPRWLSFLALALSVGMSAFFLIKTVPAAREQGSFISHYNLYVGIDELKDWPWVFFYPAIWISGTVIDLVVAYGVFRNDFHLAISLFALALLWSLPWSGILFYLTLVNL